MSLHQQALRNKMAAAPPDSEQNGQNGQDSVMKEQQRKIQQLYGGLPKKTVVNRAPTGQRKYFDSGDYALAKAGKTSAQEVGTTVPSPAMIPHVNSPSVVSQTLTSSPSASPQPVAVSDVMAPANNSILAKSPPSEPDQGQAASVHETGIPPHTREPEQRQALEDLRKEIGDAEKFA